MSLFIDRYILMFLFLSIASVITYRVNQHICGCTMLLKSIFQFFKSFFVIIQPRSSIGNRNLFSFSFSFSFYVRLWIRVFFSFILSSLQTVNQTYLPFLLALWICILFVFAVFSWIENESFVSHCRDQHGLSLTPLMNAAWYGHADCVSLLVEGKANLNARNKVRNVECHFFPRAVFLFCFCSKSLYHTLGNFSLISIDFFILRECLLASGVVLYFSKCISKPSSIFCYY